ncbi:acyltransferase [Candidatus Daviesbacteria bacterium]|nr:acyltransferase [Candidatus Daviesbacteria bacterium]
MKALREIGIKKAVYYLFFKIFDLLVDLSPIPQVRSILLQLAGVKIGKENVIHDVSFFNYYKKGFSTLKIGSYCFIGDGVMIDLSGGVVLENHVTLSNRVLVLTHTNVGYKNHPLQKFFPKFTKKVLFKEGCYVGAGAQIMPGVVIGECAVVGAGAVVIKNVQSWTVVGGIPAKKIRKIIRA